MTIHDRLRAEYNHLATANAALATGPMLPSDRDAWRAARRNAYRAIQRLEARGASIAR